MECLDGGMTHMPISQNGEQMNRMEAQRKTALLFLLPIHGGIEDVVPAFTSFVKRQVGEHFRKLPTGS